MLVTFYFLDIICRLHFLKSAFRLSPSLLRLRGASNLKQNLPHFGDDDKDGLEVLDFVKYYDRDHNNLQYTTKTRNALHRRMNPLRFSTDEVKST